MRVETVIAAAGIGSGLAIIFTWKSMGSIWSCVKKYYYPTDKDDAVARENPYHSPDKIVEDESEAKTKVEELGAEKMRDNEDGKKATEVFWGGKGDEVEVQGDFTGWEKGIPLRREADGNFRGTLSLAPGEYQFKFVVDGEWVHSDDFPTCVGGLGGTNNVITVL